eukprot:gene8185-531_t
MRNNKAAGADGVVAELIKYGGGGLRDQLFDLVGMCWEHGEVPAAWRDAVMIPIPKKGNLRLCDSWRGISLLSVPGKIYAKILCARLNQIAERVLPESANGFRAGRGTLDCIALTRFLLSRVNVSEGGTLHSVFADVGKAFDNASRDGIWIVLRRNGVPPRLLAALRSLHDGMEARVRLNGRMSESFPCLTGVRQGCCVAPVLYNLWHAAVLAEWRRELPEDIEVEFRVQADITRARADQGRPGSGSVRIDDSSYADDTAWHASSWETCKRRWSRFVEVTRRFGVTISYRKTVHMVSGEDDTEGDLLAADPDKQDEVGPWMRIHQVDIAEQLGSVHQADGGYEAEVSKRLRVAGATWGRLKPLCFASRVVARRRKWRVFSAFVLSKLLVGVGAWAAPAPQVRRLQTFYDRCLRTMTGYTTVRMRDEHVTDAQIRTWLGAPHLRELVDRECLRWAGHVARMSATRLPLRILFGHVPKWPYASGVLHGNRRPFYHTRVTQACTNFGMDPSLALDAAQDADRWRRRIHAEGWSLRTDQAARLPNVQSVQDAPPAPIWPQPTDFAGGTSGRCADD